MIENEQNLIQKLNSGDKEAFNEIFRRFYPMLCAYTQRFVYLDEAESLVQDIFLWVWENHEFIVIEQSLAAFLFKIAYRKALNSIKHKKIVEKNNNLFIRSMKEQLEDEDFYQIAELSRLIQESISKLPETYREAFVMHRFNDLSYKEIAQKLNVSHKTIDYRIQQALKILREDLKDYLPMLLTFYVLSS